MHLAVVDPGVGTARRPLALSTARGDFLVGPDNGLLLDAAEALGGLTGAWALDIEQGPDARRPSAGGSVDHLPRPRPLRAASALLACRSRPAVSRPAVDLASLVRLASSPAKATDGGISAPVIEIDRFGNVGLGLPFADTPGRGRVRTAEFLVEVAGEGAARMDGPGGARPTEIWPRANSDLSGTPGDRRRSRSTEPARPSSWGSDEASMVTLTPATGGRQERRPNGGEAGRNADRQADRRPAEPDGPGDRRRPSARRGAGSRGPARGPSPTAGAARRPRRPATSASAGSAPPGPKAAARPSANAARRDDLPKRCWPLYRPDLAQDPGGRRRALVPVRTGARAPVAPPGMPFAEASILPADLRAALDAAGASVLSVAATRKAADGTTKLLLERRAMGPTSRRCSCLTATA